MATLLFGILIVALVATGGDIAWYGFGVEHTVAAGVIHGAALLTAVGGVLGATCGRILRGLPIGMAAGIGGALSYYAIVAAFGGGRYGAAIPAAWVITWLLLAVLEGRWLRTGSARRAWPEVAGRGAFAAIASGLTFYLVLDVLWGRTPDGGRNYFIQVAAWAAAWAPGLLILGTSRTRSRR